MANTKPYRHRHTFDIIIITITIKKTNLTCRERTSRTGYKVRRNSTKNTEGNAVIDDMIDINYRRWNRENFGGRL